MRGITNALGDYARLRGLCVALAALCGGKSSLELGLDAFERRDFARAAAEFSKLVKEDPRSARAWKLLGMAYAGAEDYVRAEEPCSRACALNPREENACYYLGRVSYALGKLVQSRAAYESALAHGDRRGRTELGLALTYEQLSSLQEAERHYRLAIGAGEARAKVDYGLFLFKSGRLRESLAMLREAGAGREAAMVEKALRDPPAVYGEQRPAPPAVQFEATDLDMVVNNGATGEKHLIETMPAGVAAFDFDGDGWADIFVANGAEIPSLRKTGPRFYNRLFRNRHDGTFRDVTEQAGLAGAGYSMGVAAGDFDNDGHVDLFVTGVRGNTLYRNRGDGTFEDVTAAAGVGGNGEWSVAAGWFDYDNDGRLDLFVVRYVQWEAAQERFCGFPEAGIRQYCHPRLYEPLPNALYRNAGGGRFRDVSAASGIAAHPGKGMGVAFGDFDADGFTDVFVANDSIPNFLFRNRGNGTFEEIAMKAGVAYNSDGAAVSSMGADFRDYDNDGREDIFVTALSNETFPLFRNTGREFSDATYPSGVGRSSFPWSGWSCGMFDFNNDGWKDIFTANGHVMDNVEKTSGRKSKQPNAVFVNEGGRFRMQLLPGEALHRGAAFADFDRDGRVDAVVTELNGRPRVLRNVTPSPGHWVGFRLEGARSNRDGIGARVHIVTEGGEQWNRATTSVGYGGSSDRTVHFGLGAETIVKRTEIDWPSGRKQVLRDVTADRYITVREPEE